jgi:murein DD-endopeptidase MepM/ murein hydrolase activator NlpD
MNTIDTTIAALQTSASPAATDAERARVKDLAEQFESMLLSQMLKEMRRGMLSDDAHEEGLGAGAFTDSMDSQLGLALSRTGGMGIAEILTRAIDRQVGTVGGPAVDVGRPFQGRLDGEAESLAPQTPDIGAPAGPITSNFGWRNDPVSGQVKFHSGRDIRMAYGQDVRSAASGTVTFAGERGGYGMTVEVDHGGGMVTRYAHLSSSSVAVGQAVESGQVIANSGNSGRSTGPHLHFEVLDNGRPVDPDTPIQGFSRVADLNPGRVLHGAGHSIG